MIVVAILAEHAGLIISDDQERLDHDCIRAWLADAYWSIGRSAEAIERSIAGSRCYGVYHGDGSQLALTRAVTDLATFCWLGDVIVDAAWRGRGLGHWLVGTALDDLRAAGVPRFLLATRDAHGVYHDLGFAALAAPQMMLELDLRVPSPA